MAGLSHELLADLRNVLLDCGPFYSAADLRAVFVDERIRPWRDNLPEASNTTGRVDAVVSYLIDRRNRSGESALLLLVQVLRDRANKSEDCYDRLDAMAGRLERTLNQLNQLAAAATPTHHSPPPAPSASVDLVRLYQLLDKTFSLEELRTLCFSLGIEFDDLTGDGKGAKTRELVMYMHRRGRIADLIAKAKQERPHVSW